MTRVDHITDLCALILGAVSVTDVDLYLRVLVALVSLAFLVPGAVLRWRRVFEQKPKSQTDNAHTD